MSDGALDKYLRGDSPALKTAKESICAAAKSGPWLHVLIIGETGTGKEVAAEAIHKLSPERSLPFRAINCSGLNKNLLESELFGYVKGAFSGADRDRLGLLDDFTRGGGTLFLDELPDMDVAVQAKLLRYLESWEYRPVGSRETKKAKVRVVAAAQPKLIEEGRLRPDLLSRIADVKILMPSLNEHSARGLEDIARGLLEKLAEEGLRNKSGEPFSQSKVASVLGRLDYKMISRHDWSAGNVRELRSYIKRCALLYDFDLPPKATPQRIVDESDAGPLFARIPRTFAEVQEMKVLQESYVDFVASNFNGEGVTAIARKLAIHINTYKNLRIKSETTRVNKSKRSAL